MNSDRPRALDLVAGVFLRPVSALSSAARDRRFVAAMMILLVAVAVCAWISAPLQMERSRAMLENSSLNQYMEGEPLPLTAAGWQRVAIAVWVALMSLLAVVVVAFLLYLLYGAGGVEGQYANFFGLTVHAALVGTVLPRILLTVGTALHLPVLHWVSPGTWAHLAGLRGPLVSILGQMDLFTLWFLLIVALGVSAWSGISRRRSLFIALGYLMFKSVVLGFLGYFGSRALS